MDNRRSEQLEVGIKIENLKTQTDFAKIDDLQKKFFLLVIQAMKV